MIIAFVGAASLGLMLLWIWRILRLDEPSIGRWLVKVADVAAFLAFMILVARWDILGLRLRTVILLIAAMAALASLRRHRTRPWRAPTSWAPRERWPNLLSLTLMLGLAGAAASGLAPPRDARALACPLAGGRFVIGQGGGNRLVNHHAGHPAQAHAADILGVGPWGFRATGPLPRDLDRYAIHGARVVSPCAGRVIGLRDGLPDQTPPRSDPAHAAGNHVVLACGALRVELAHLARGSLAVVEGQSVAVGTPIGRVGNSGNTTEPHLHIHAVDAATGVAVPTTLGGVAPARNRLLVCP